MDFNERTTRFPVHTNTFALPNDVGVKVAYTVYNPSDEALQLESEKKRTIYAEAFITNPNLGPLSDLCLRAIADAKGLAGFSVNENDTLKQRLQLDSIDIDEPLENIYEIEDKLFWKRVALGKTSEADLKLKDNNYDWKTEGVTLKYVELVEECPAEFWPEQKMCILAAKVKDHVIHMRIRKLQPMKESSFSHYIGRDSDTDKTTTTDVSDSTSEEDFYETTPDQVEEESDDIEKADTKSVISYQKSHWSFFRPTKQDEDSNSDTSRMMVDVEKQKEIRKADRRKRRESQQKRRELREEKRLKRQEEENRPKPRRIRVKNVFDLRIDEPKDQEHKQLDHRNLQSFLKFKRKNIYIPDRCHHINLSFLSYFDELVSFHIEFQPPPLKTHYHARYFEFSHDDISLLAIGISSLQKLRIFRLRNSRMDARKLGTIVSALNKLNVEVVDFGNDHLRDDCAIELPNLFQKTPTIKSLELEGNQLGLNSMNALGNALQRYWGKLEYLGLARNPIGDDGLHALTKKIAFTEQIESLCLAGIRLNDVAIQCCIGEELLNRHNVLRSLDIMGSPLSSESGEILVKCMRSNYNVVELECRGCDLSESIEMDIEICLLRNRHKAEHKFIGDKNATEANINEYVKQIRNPILLDANEKLQKKRDCMDARPNIAKIYSTSTIPSVHSSAPIDSVSFNYLQEFRKFSPMIENTSDHPASKEESAKELKILFEYNVMDFDEKQLIEHVNIPGPSNRYYYFKSKHENLCSKYD